MFKTTFSKPSLFLLVLLNVLILHIYIFYNITVSQSYSETKKDLNYIATLTIIHEESEKVVKVDKKVIVKKVDVPKKVIKADEKVTAKKEKIAEKVVKKEDIDISDESKTEEKKKTISKEVETKDNDNRSVAIAAASDKREKSVLDAKRQDQYLNEYISYTNRTIQEKKFYPKTAKNMRIEGNCILKLTILSSGEIANIKVVERSYFSIFDKSALKIIEMIGSFKAFPQSLKRETVTLQIPIKYTLEG